jgi:hypothetical protein
LPDTEDAAADSEADDAGEPIALLAALRETPAAGFVPRLRRSVERRRLGGTAAELGWSAVVLLAVEYLGVVFDSLRTREGGGTDERR